LVRVAPWEEYIDLNRAGWDERAPVHAASPTYEVDRLLSGPHELSHVVAFDLPRLGDVSGARGLHLQCHIGTDTLSLSRLGAQMTGLDFSPAALEQACRIARKAGAAIDFVQADVYRAPQALGRGRFDLIYTGVGALCWLPSIERWAAIVDELLEPGGRLFVREGHPMLWTIDEARATADGVIAVTHDYFERPEPYVEESSESYAETDVELSSVAMHSWNHGLGEIVTALLDRGLSVAGLAEHDSVPWNALPARMVRDARGEYRLLERPWRLACSYTLQAVKAH
jgi:SAM-dependent methyltransferase